MWLNVALSALSVLSVVAVPPVLSVIPSNITPLGVRAITMPPMLSTVSASYQCLSVLRHCTGDVLITPIHCFHVPLYRDFPGESEATLVYTSISTEFRAPFSNVGWVSFKDMTFVACGVNPATSSSAFLSECGPFSTMPPERTEEIMAVSDRGSADPHADDHNFTTPDNAHAATPDDVVVTALNHFAKHGFNETKLEKIAKASGMSKRMIHYYFGDKKGLYIKTISHALDMLRPDAEAMQLESAVPVDGVRKIVEAIYNSIINNPEAIRLILMENLHNHGGVESAAAFNDESNLLLNLDKLLMLGQDAGAFRPGISAEDVLVLISSLGYFRMSNQLTMDQIYDLDLTSDVNIEGMRRLVVDTVLAFLTSNLPDAESASYLTTRDSAIPQTPDTDIYAFDTDLFED